MGMHTDSVPAPDTSIARLEWAEAHGEYGIYRFGKLPETYDYYGFRVSRNHRDGGYEDGVSVYEGWLVGDVLVLDLRKVDAASALFIIDPSNVYKVTGTMCASTGSDGEPLMYDDGDDVLLSAKIAVSAVQSVLV